MQAWILWKSAIWADPELFEESKFGKWKFCHEDAIRKVLGDILDPKMQLAVMADVDVQRGS